ncbi:MAG: helix-turn-helix transcriptional regulator [Bacteroides sp.]|nr:helix-turn-helix transcriptional regulator [Eubacterium sp.]MCM1417637.1 helix-turn-helix transcriptional regulator [Roseburia sp.]MCM1461898.1 helix-turn-helix transcriptional regulator [Bacteroides sp.]
MTTIKVYEIRTRREMSLRTLADLSGVSKSQINDIENAFSSPTLYTLELIAKALKCKIGDLYEES